MNESEFRALPDGKVFARGVVLDGQPYFNFDRKERVLKWVAKKGYARDWAIYLGLLDWTWDEVERQGNKLHTEKLIRYLVPCSVSVIMLYRS